MMNLENAGVNVQEHKVLGSLVIIDSVRGYHLGDVYAVCKLIQTLHQRAIKEQRNGVLCFGDVGSFFMLNKVYQLIDYELTIPKKVDLDMRIFCCYYRRSFEQFDTAACRRRGAPQKKLGPPANKRPRVVVVCLRP